MNDPAGIDLSGLTWLQALCRRSGQLLAGNNRARSLINACPSRHGVTRMEVIGMPSSVHSRSPDVFKSRLQIRQLWYPTSRVIPDCILEMGQK